MPATSTTLMPLETFAEKLSNHISITTEHKDASSGHMRESLESRLRVLNAINDDFHQLYRGRNLNPNDNTEAKVITEIYKSMSAALGNHRTHPDLTFSGLRAINSVREFLSKTGYKGI